jgi:hypothetical protein
MIPTGITFERFNLFVEKGKGRRRKPGDLFLLDGG